MAYSYSKLECFDYCSKKYQFKYIQFLQEPYGKAAEIGVEIHKCLSDYILHLANNGLKNDVAYIYTFKHSENIELFESFKINYKLPDTITKDNVQTEKFIKISKDFISVPEDAPKDSIFFNMAIDLYWVVGNKAYIIDWKSGKNKITDDHQLQAYAWGLKIKHPDVHEIEVGFYYLRDHKMSSIILTDFILPQNQILDKISTIENTKLFTVTKDFWKCRSCCFKNSVCSGAGITNKKGVNALFS